MTSFFQVHPYVIGFLLSLLLFLAMLQLGCLFATIGDTGRHLVKQIVLVFAGTFTNLVLLRYLNEKIGDGFRPVLKSGWARLYGFPVEAEAILIAVLSIYTFYLFNLTWKSYQNSISRSSIKESIDNLPPGLRFSAPNGRILLANRRMEMLCRTITGADFQDAEMFWDYLTQEKNFKGTKRISSGDAPSFQLKDGTVWTFRQKVLQVNGNKILQLTAVDTTQLYGLSSELQENNKKLKEMNGRLKQYSENIDEYVRNKEILEAKMRIHNEMGQALLSSRSYLLQESSVLQEADILKQWNYVVALLKKESETKNPKNSWSYFVDAADAAGVKILMDGDIPKNEDVAKLIVSAATEALTNAVRHGGADELYVKLAKENGKIRITFTNNGQNPIGPVQEGGGLESLRLRLEEAGGSMTIETEPRFALTASVPVWR